MTRPAIGKLTLLTALAAGLIVALPTAAQARTQAPAPGQSYQIASSLAPDGEIWWFSGDTYPDTSVGLSACTAEGVYERGHGVSTYSCRLGDPDAGLYGLWLGDVT